MTLVYVEPTDGASGDVLSEAQQTYIRASRALNKLVDELDDGDIGRGDESVKLLDQFKRALNNALAEKERLENDRRKAAGIVNEYAIDFDAARSEIGRRLACLRAAGGAGDVSE